MGNEYRLTRRGFIGAAAGAAAATAMTGPAALASTAGAPGGGGGPQRDLALINGKIHTFDEHDTVTDRVLVRDGRIAAVGSTGGGPAQVINLRGRTVIPGLIDNHTHFIRVGNAAGHDTRRLETAFTVEEAQQVIAAEADRVPEGEFITDLAGIRRQQFAEGRFPDLTELDEAAPAHPVVISELVVGQTNTLGRDILRSLGVTVDDDGVVANQNQAYSALAPSITHESRKQQLLNLFAWAGSVGLTAVMDDHGSTGGAGFLDRVTGHDAILDLWREERLTLRVRARFPEQSSTEELQIIVNNRWERFGDSMMQISGVGEWAPRGANYQTSLRIMAERPYIYHQHLIPTPEIEAHINALEQFEAENPQFSVADLHWSGGHMDGTTEEQILRMNNLGFGIVPFPAGRYHAATPGAPFRMIVDLAEVPVGTGTDGARVAPLNPWTAVYYMTTGINSGGVLTNPGQQITRGEALRLFAGPQQGWFCKEEHRLGGIAVGRYADLAVLSADVFDHNAVPDDQLRKMTSVLTIVDGRIVYEAGVLDVG